MVVDRRELERLIPALRRYARGLTGDQTSADDLVQDGLVQALANERQFRGNSLAAWMYAIVTNLARSHRRSGRRVPPLDAGADPSDSGSDPAARVAIIAALSALAPEFRETLLLVAVEGFSYREAAEVLGVPTGTVMSRLARARAQLAERLEGAPVVPIRRVK